MTKSLVSASLALNALLAASLLVAVCYSRMSQPAPLASTAVSASTASQTRLGPIAAMRPSMCSRSSAGRVAVKSAAVPRRGMMGGLVSAGLFAGSMLNNNQAKAGLFGPGQREVYERETSQFLDELKKTLALPKDDEGKKEAVLNLKVEGNRWVAKWRNSKMSSSPSFGNLYSVVNAVNGHYNTFGPNSNLPKKRMARVEKEISDASKYLTKGR
eukprot:CAMPEP_0197515640 /NCGR_PEP_ID=MMETSP1318-20131121/709_1 /TAXON_ID=552666 /ORGANISM="Partenskyella glossopodia, Strain RCC365" /LENGTH=213 /DNA_ID=CAMNT_0043064065 /DNA_START=56 /DNA_END=697 /DNA_ORIENTATION=+